MSERTPLVELNIAVDREAFVRETAVGLLRTLKVDAVPLWGMMTAQHMVEHLIYITENTLGIRSVELLIPVEKLGRYKAFLMSNNGFMRNFKFPLLPANELSPLTYASLEDALNAFEQINMEVISSLNSPEFESAPHPFYGQMNREEAIMFQFKHLMHHLMQFGLVND